MTTTTKIESSLLKHLKNNNMSLNDYLNILDNHIKTDDYLKPFSEFFLLFTSMIRNNKGKYLCPFNDWYFAITDNQAKYLMSLKNKSYKGKEINQEFNNMLLMIENFNPIEFKIYTPKTNGKMYIGIVPRFLKMYK